MFLSTKHANQQSITYAQFNNGLNTMTAQEMIAQNELSQCLNMEIDSTTGLLKTVDGCKLIYAPDISLIAMLYDNINKTFLLIDKNKKVYKSDLKTYSSIGTLTGDLFPVGTPWEDGLLVSSGGKLQYWNGTTFDTLSNSPDKCTYVYVRSGRVIVAVENEIKYSSVGDESDWTDDSNVDSSSKWVEVGYKDGGKILAIVPMESNTLIIKGNRRVYNLTGSYPNWNITEVSRNIDCLGRLAWHAAGDSVLILGRNEIQQINSNALYGDIKANNIASKITNKLADINEENPRMIYLPPLNQVWIPLKQRYVLVFDCNTQSFFMRRFSHEDIVDVVCVDKTVYVVRPSSISILQKNLFEDLGEYMVWRFVGKRMISSNDFLLKKVVVNITPYFEKIVEGNIKIGGVVLPLPTPFVANRLWHNYSRLYHNRRHCCGANERSYNLYDCGVDVYENFDRIWHNYQPLYNPATVAMGTRAVNRNKTIAVSGTGRGGSFVINTINFNVAEV